ncbi:hypothetical protein [Dongia deserti]|uniref:hypothetical protein n=1 Tax=Dongia deserti TaxID=2268030 RepID=UPI0013C49D3B|nr:hypothetical protein [Dongia deserti]
MGAAHSAHGNDHRVERILVGNYAIGDTFVSDEDERKLTALREQVRAARDPS